MPQAPLLPRTLALAACAGAVVFLFLTSPSCDPHADGPNPRAAQRRAMAAAANANVTANAENRPQRDQPNASRKAPSPNEIHLRSSAPRTAASRDFLLWRGQLEPGAEERLREPAQHYRGSRAAWVANQIRFAANNLSGRPLSEGYLLVQTKVAEMIRQQIGRFRGEVRLLRLDRSMLTNDSLAEYDRWEAKNWEGYGQTQPGPSLFLPRTRGAAGPSLTDRAGAEFLAHAFPSVQPLLDEMEFLDDWIGEHESVLRGASTSASLPDTGSTGPVKTNLEELHNMRRNTQEKLDGLIGVAGAQYLEWQQRNWKGYELTGTWEEKVPDGTATGAPEQK